MQATHPRVIAEYTHHAAPTQAMAQSTTAPLSRSAPFTLWQTVARYTLTVLAIAAMSALFATQIAATLR
jgi:hypothetical protein